MEQEWDETVYVVVMKRVHGDTPKMCKTFGESFTMTPEEAGSVHGGMDGDTRTSYEVREIKVSFSKKGEELWPDFADAVVKGFAHAKGPCSCCEALNRPLVPNPKGGAPVCPHCWREV